MAEVKEVFIPHLNRTMKMGRRRPLPHAPRMKLAMKSYMTANLPPPPPTMEYSDAAAASLSNIYVNDKLGCCVVAGGYHVEGVETGNADGGTPFIASDDQIIADYSAISGYKPGDPSTDIGCDETTALNYWTTHGFANGTKLHGYLNIDSTNKTEVMQALYICENLFFGIELPDAWINPFPGPGFIWDVGTPDLSNGHCVVGVGYDDIGVQICTWGMIGTITWAAISQLCCFAGNGQLFTLLSPDQICASKLTAPNGFDWNTLLTDFDGLGGRGGLVGGK